VGEFGEKFRKAREAKSLSLDDVSNVTKIGSRMLQAIEQEHFDQLPGGVFNKGFIRAYAKHLGLNSEEAVTDYLTCLRQAQVDAHEVWDPVPPKPAAPPPPPAPERRPLAPYRKPALKMQPPTQLEELPELQLPRAEDVRPPRNKYLNDRRPEIPWRIIAVAAVVIVLAMILWTRRSHTTRTQAATASPAPATQSASVNTTAPAPTNPSSKNQSASTTPHATPPPQTPRTSPTTNQPAPTPPKPPAPTVEAKNDPNKSDPNKEDATKDKDKDKDKDVIVRTFPPSKSATPTTAAASLTLVIRATETSWISVTADGQPASEETLIAPAHTSIRATRQIVAKVGNAAGVTFLWNGQEIPAQGAESEVKTFIFDSSGMHTAPSSPSQ
jgi:cytoskeletal protein RodZ